MKQNWLYEFKYSDNGHQPQVSFHCRDTIVIKKCGYKPTT